MIIDYYVVTDIQYTVSFEIENFELLPQTPLTLKKQVKTFMKNFIFLIINTNKKVYLFKYFLYYDIF